LNATIVAAGSLDPVESAVNEFAIQHLRDAGLSEEVINQHREGKPVSIADREVALRFKNALFNDKAQLAKLYAGDTELRRKVATMNMLLSLPIQST
jgi:hypothetical protein